MSIPPGSLLNRPRLSTPHDKRRSKGKQLFEKNRYPFAARRSLKPLWGQVRTQSAAGHSMVVFEGRAALPLIGLVFHHN
jgi:hypothetical protein